MGDVITFTPNSKMEFEETALVKMAAISDALCRTPEMIAKAHQSGDTTICDQVDAVVFKLSVLEAGMGMLEEIAPELIDALIPNEAVQIIAENAAPNWNVMFRATTRSRILYIKDFYITPDMPTVRIKNTHRAIYCTKVS